MEIRNDRPEGGPLIFSDIKDDSGRNTSLKLTLGPGGDLYFTIINPEKKVMPSMEITASGGQGDTDPKVLQFRRRMAKLLISLAEESL